MEHEHTPIFDIKLINLDKEKEVEVLQGISTSGKVKFIINESNFIHFNIKGSSYQICVTPNEDSFIFDKSDILKLSLVIQTIEEDQPKDVDLSNVPKNKDAEKLVKKLDKLQNKIIDIMRTQNYQIEREDEYSSRAVHNSSAIVYMTVIQIGILIVLTIWQIYSFKDIFKDAFSVI
jgi:hypothetical protein